MSGSRSVPFVAAFVITLAVGGTASAQDAAAGKKVFSRCMACHNVDKEQNKVGPHLVGLFGREAGSVEGYNYSKAHKASGITWNAETLNTYLENPKAMIPGNKMAFAGLKKEEDRANIIAYLEEASKGS